jgi:arylsulfatase A
MMATLAEVMGDTLPPDAGEDSFSLMPLLGGQDKPVREHAVSASVQGLPSIRLGPWKYILGKGSGGWWGKDDAVHQLYQMDEDPSESRNQEAEQPERVKEMAALFERLIVRGRSNAGPNQRNDVEVKRYQLGQ